MINIYIENTLHGYLVSSPHGKTGIFYYFFYNLKDARSGAREFGFSRSSPYRIIEHIRPLTIPKSLMATKKTYSAKKKAVVKKKKVVKAKKK